MINRENNRDHQEDTTEEKMRGTPIEESVLIEALTREIKNIGKVTAEIDITNMIGIKEKEITLDQKKEMMIITKGKKGQESQVKKVEAMVSKKFLKKSKKGDKKSKQKN
jgi:hypothetical protein